MLRKVGGLEIAGLVGLILSAAARRIPVVVDGFISSAAAALACGLQPRIRHFLFAAHRSSELGHSSFWNSSGRRRCWIWRCGLAGTGAALCMTLIEAAAKLMNEMATFSSAGVSEAVG